MNIHTESLSEQFVNLIMEMIMNKELVAGEQVPTKKIADDHGVSVMPVRLALRELADRKIVVNRSRVGYFVAEYSVDELIRLSNCRRMFEMYCLEHYFDSLDLEKLHALYDSIRDNIGDHFNNLTYQKDDAILHSSFVLASHNEFILTQYNQVKDLFSLCIIYDSDNMEHNYLSRTEHMRMLDYIFKKKKDAALLELKNHLDRTDRTIIELGETNRLKESPAV